MKPQIYKNGKRIDKEVKSVDFEWSNVCYVDKKDTIHWSIWPDEVELRWSKSE